MTELDHCFCCVTGFTDLTSDHVDRMCCWCSEHRSHRVRKEQVEGHGPARTKLVVLPDNAGPCPARVT